MLQAAAVDRDSEQPPPARFVVPVAFRRVHRREVSILQDVVNAMAIEAEGLAQAAQLRFRSLPGVDPCLVRFRAHVSLPRFIRCWMNRTCDLLPGSQIAHEQILGRVGANETMRGATLVLVEFSSFFCKVADRPWTPLNPVFRHGPTWAEAPVVPDGTEDQRIARSNDLRLAPPGYSLSSLSDWRKGKRHKISERL